MYQFRCVQAWTTFVDIIFGGSLCNFVYIAFRSMCAGVAHAVVCMLVDAFLFLSVRSLHLPVFQVFKKNAWAVAILLLYI